MRILVTGARGMLGRRLGEECERRGHKLLAYDQPDLQLEHPDEAAALLSAGRPDLVIHAAALTDVDGCESREAEALALNGTASGKLAAAARRLGAAFIFISSDYVFDGTKGEPYAEEDTPHPATAYGRSKLLGEKLSLQEGGCVVRLSWSFGPDGKNFVRTVAEKLAAGESLRVVDDQRGSPTYTRDAAAALLDLAAAQRQDFYHCTNHGATSWFGFAREIAKGLGLPPERVAPCTSAEFPRPAPRPADSRLSCARLEALRGAMPPWQEALTRYLEEERWLARP